VLVYCGWRDRLKVRACWVIQGRFRMTRAGRYSTQRLPIEKDEHVRARPDGIDRDEVAGGIDSAYAGRNERQLSRSRCGGGGTNAPESASRTSPADSSTASLRSSPTNCVHPDRSSAFRGISRRLPLPGSLTPAYEHRSSAHASFYARRAEQMRDLHRFREACLAGSNDMRAGVGCNRSAEAVRIRGSASSRASSLRCL
jgi:hypothetical protein